MGVREGCVRAIALIVFFVSGALIIWASAYMGDIRATPTTCEIVGFETESRILGEGIYYNPVWIVNYTVVTEGGGRQVWTGRIGVVYRGDDGSFEGKEEAAMHTKRRPLGSVEPCAYHKRRRQEVAWGFPESMASAITFSCIMGVIGVISGTIVVFAPCLAKYIPKSHVSKQSVSEPSGLD